MNIVIDVRPLLGGRLSGVEVYTLRLIEHLLKIDRKNRYVLFSNSARKDTPDLTGSLSDNVKILHTSVPNKIMNLSLKLLRRPKIDQLVTKYIPDFKPDVVFQPDLRSLAVKKGTKKICVIHDLSFHHFPHFFSLKKRIWHKFLKAKEYLRDYDRIIAVSEFTKKDLISTFGLDPGRITVIHEGIEEDFCSTFSPVKADEIKTRYHLPDNFFLFLATHEPRKNLSRLAKAFKSFKESDKMGYKLVLVGRSNEKIFAKNRINPDDDILITGFVPEEDKPYLFRMAKAFLYPSIFEGFGLPLLEAMKCGTPIITSDTSSMPEICADAALYVNPHSTADLVSAMHKIVEHAERQELKDNMSKRIKAFSWDKCAMETLSLIESI